MERDLHDYAVTNDLAIKILTPDDWQLCAKFNLEALQLEPWAFTATYRHARNATEHHWRNVSYLRRRNQSFVLYKAGEPIGSTMLTIERINNQQIAQLQNSYLRQDERHKHYSDYLYRIRLAHALAAGIEVAQMACRASNEPSRKAAAAWLPEFYNMHKKVLFGDKTRDDVLYFRTNLQDIAPKLAELDRIDPIPILTNR